MSKFQIGNILFRTKITQIRAELIEQLRASVIHMIHTPDGARCGLHCIWFGSAKDRKLILKTIKEFIEKVLTAEYGHLLVLGTIDSGKFQKFSVFVIVHDRDDPNRDNDRRNFLSKFKKS